MKDSATALEKMYQQLSAIHPIEETAWKDFQGIWTTASYKRKEVVTAAGEVERYLYWVVEGVQRGFHLHDQKEATVVFTYPGSFSGIIDSFLLQQPSRYYLETLTSSHFLRASYRQVEECRLQHPSIAELMYKALAFTTSGILERQIELMVYSAEEKFRTLLKRSPHILQLVPHKYLASYLGIDATTFSKLLGTIRLG
ncbi:cyclic nucleotide-binding domain-containing protein [Flavihumibacter sp. RY-1]|uniref:Cyclic nucleotide-binding domain-containing protein n=1 Tax=Flavihumibacter fluminis TaxID=2909236 RepID=A0ABS9BF63_9BACT|nr:cyclic nucleotide-binding domain-containing protein [Flavihumibacter fluminis]MCF1714242.1 cyclic nucleotide-binding domain-containing protein [Flavihumibacter fluminis]